MERIAEEFGITPLLSLRPAQVSGGGQKLVAYARAAILQPRLLYLDEPTSFLDSRAVDQLKSDLRRRIRSGCTVVAVTHDAELAALVADNLVVLDQGRILRQGPTAEVIRSPDQRVREILEEILREAAVFDHDILALLRQDAAVEETAD